MSGLLKSGRRRGADLLRVAAVALCFGLLPQSAIPQDAPIVVTPVLSTTTTAAGQPIRLPAKDAEVVVATYEIAPGAKLPAHKHPFARYAYVLSGELRVTNAETGAATEYRAGEFIVEMIDTWHFGENVGAEPVRLVVIDQVEAGQTNTVLQKPQ